MFKRLINGLFARSARDEHTISHSGPLQSASYRLEIPDDWYIEEAGGLASIRGPGGELVQVSSVANTATREPDYSAKALALRQTVESVLAKYVQNPELTVLDGPIDGATPSGIPYREIVLRAPAGNLVAGYAVHGPRSSVLLTLDYAPDRESVHIVRRFVMAIEFKRSV